MIARDAVHSVRLDSTGAETHGSGASIGLRLNRAWYRFGSSDWKSSLRCIPWRRCRRSRLRSRTELRSGFVGELQDEERWTQAFSGSQDALSRLAGEARADIKAGRATATRSRQTLKSSATPVSGLPTANCQRIFRGSQERRTVPSQAIPSTEAYASRACTATSRSTQLAPTLGYQSGWSP